MRSKLILFAAVCVAALALSTPASAATILQFAQSNSSDFVQAAVSGSTTTLTTHGVLFANSIAITISQDGTAQNVNAPAFLTFTPVVTGLTSITGGAGPPPAQNGFNGTIVISSGANAAGPTGLIILTAVITNGRLDALQNSATGSFLAANGASNGGNPVFVGLTSSDPNIVPALLPATGGPGAVSLAFISITPTQSGSGFTNFTTQIQGSFATVPGIPEPASFLSASTAIVAGLGCFGWSRRKSSQA